MNIFLSGISSHCFREDHEHDKRKMTVQMQTNLYSNRRGTWVAGCTAIYKTGLLATNRY